MVPRQSAPRGRHDRRGPRAALRLLCAATLLLPLVLSWLSLPGCRATKPDPPGESAGDLTLIGDIVPLILEANPSKTATIWVTVMRAQAPVTDSTKVNLVATLGTVPEVVYTRDGLAVATYQAAAETGVATIVAQALGVRDTMRITLY